MVASWVVGSITQDSARVRGKVSAVRLRLGMGAVARASIWSALAATPFALGLAYADRLSLAMLVVIVAYALGAAVAIARRPNRIDAVRVLDRACEAEDLVVTATAIADGRAGGGRFAPIVVADAAKRLAGTNVASVAPLTALPSAIVAAVLAFVGPWLISPPRAIDAQAADGAMRKSVEPVKDSDLRPDRGEIVRRAPSTPIDRELVSDPKPEPRDDAVAINPRIPGQETDGTGGNTPSQAPSAGIGAGEGTVGTDRRQMRSLPMNLRASASGAIDVEVGQAGTTAVSAAVPADYRQVVADFMSEAK